MTQTPSSGPTGGRRAPIAIQLRKVSRLAGPRRGSSVRCLRRLTAALSVGVVLSACGSTASDSGTDSAAAESIDNAVPTTAEPAPVSADQVKCAAWSTMMSQQPSGQFADDADLSDAFSTFATAVDDARTSFPPEQATVLENYAKALIAFAAEPSSPEANATVADMTGPMSALTGEIAAECGPEVVNNV